MQPVIMPGIAVRRLMERMVRQRGTPMRAGPNVGVGTDHTLFALVHGRVVFARKGPEQRTFVSVLPEAASATN